MRRKLVESALFVFAEKGVDASVIEDVIAAAGVSRGTFYNYFRTNGELLVAAIEELGDEVVDLVIAGEGDALAGRAALHRLKALSRRRATLSAVRPVHRARGPAGGRPRQSGLQIHSHSHRRGIKAGEFVDAPVGVALDMIVGAGLVAVARLSARRADDAYLHAMLLALARSLGLDGARAETLLSQPLAPLALKAELAPHAQSRPLPEAAAAKARGGRLGGLGRLRIGASPALFSLAFQQAFVSYSKRRSRT